LYLWLFPSIRPLKRARGRRQSSGQNASGITQSAEYAVSLDPILILSMCIILLTPVSTEGIYRSVQYSIRHSDPRNFSRTYYMQHRRLRCIQYASLRLRILLTHSRPCSYSSYITPATLFLYGVYNRATVIFYDMILIHDLHCGRNAPPSLLTIQRTLSSCSMFLESIHGYKEPFR
jgi:hypothetical protein